MLVLKEIARPGINFYIDQTTGQPRSIHFTPAGLQHLYDSGCKMLSCGLSIPVPVEHQPDAQPLTAAQKAAKRLLNNAGWVHSYEMKDGKLFGMLDIEDPAILDKLPKTIRWTSPWINSFVDGDGRSWNGVISHVALTSRPRIVKQEPFPNVAAAISLSVTGLSAVPQFDPASLASPIPLSAAGELTLGSGGILKPRYPFAFSLWSHSAQLAMPDEKPKEKKKPEPKKVPEGGTPTDPAAPPPIADDPQTPALPPDPANPMGGLLEPSLVEADGDISVYTVLVDLLASIGVDLPEGTSKDNFLEHAYKALMEKMKAASKTPEAPMNTDNQPNTGHNDLPRNPIVAEQPPLYMSLEEAKKIADPHTRRIAEAAALSLERANMLSTNILAGAEAQRSKRVESLAKQLPVKTRDKLLAQVKSAPLSLDGTTGQVVDPLQTTFDILEEGIASLPRLLTNPQAVQEQPQPREHDGGTLSEERRKQLADEQSKMAGAAPAA